jgi:Sporulation and spore germination
MIAEMKRRLLSGLMVAVLGAAGCSIPKDESPREIRIADVPPELTDPVRTIDLYMVSTKGPGGAAALGKVQRTAPLRTDLAATVRDAISMLRQPVTSDLTAQGFRSELPAMSFDAVLDGRKVILDITNAIALKDDGTSLGQIVLTLTGLEGVEAVDVQIRGQTVDKVRDGNLFEKSPPLTAADFDLFERRQEKAKLYYVRNGLLEPVDRVVPAIEANDNPDLAGSKYLEPLVVDGPTPDQQTQGFTSLLREPAPTLFCRTGNIPICDSYSLDFPESFDELSVSEQALAIGQALYTLDTWTRPSLGKVEIQVAGVKRREVPLPRGKVGVGLVDKTDFRSLLVESK